MGNLNCHCIGEQDSNHAVEVESIGKSKIKKPEGKILELTIDIPSMPFSLNIVELPISQTVLSI